MVQTMYEEGVANGQVVPSQLFVFSISLYWVCMRIPPDSRELTCVFPRRVFPSHTGPDERAGPEGIVPDSRISCLPAGQARIAQQLRTARACITD